MKEALVDEEEASAAFVGEEEEEEASAAFVDEEEEEEASTALVDEKEEEEEEEKSVFSVTRDGEMEGVTR